MRKLIIRLGLMLFILTACESGSPISTSIVSPTAPVTVRVQCYYAGEVIFDQPFDRAETLEDGTVRVWLGVEHVDMEGDCQIVAPMP